MWSEVERAAKEGRREVVVCGPEAAERLRREGSLPAGLWSLGELTHLRVSAAGLESLPASVSRLGQLRELLLFGNRLRALPAEVALLQRLRHLDVADNELAALPERLGELRHLQLLNARGNRLERLPQLRGLRELQQLDASANRLAAFPDLCYADNERLADLRLASNLIAEVPAAVTALPALKTLDLGANQIRIVPLEIAEIAKLKDLNLKDNNLADNRLRKLVDQCQTKQVVAFIRQNCSRAGAVDLEGSKKRGKPNSKAQQKKSEEADADVAEAAEPSCDKIRVIPCSDDTPNVKIDEAVRAVRPHIVCCAVRGLTFTEDSFKRFIQVQTKFHDTLCEKRNAATIATHDLKKITPGDLSYTALPPFKLMIRPLTRAKSYSGLELYSQLRKEADDLRKEKKRNVYSGIHKYLYLLEGKSLYPCLEDSNGTAISFPPITNSEMTKMSCETTDMLIEVTSSQSQTVCRKVMDSLLLEILNMGLGGSCDGDDRVNNRLGSFHRLEVQQMKIVDLEGKMRVIYPSKVDLFYEDRKNLKIIRET